MINTAKKEAKRKLVNQLRGTSMIKETFDIPQEEENEDQAEVDDFAVDAKDIENERVVVDFKTRF